jgi:hypothetical protein
MSTFEIKQLYVTIDANKGIIFILDNIIDDKEWSDFYELYIEEFEKFDADTNFSLK